MYHEDVDLSLRTAPARRRGWGSSRRRVVDHDYEFAKGPAKWRMLERNRWATILRCYPGPLLALLAPALLATELGAVAAPRGRRLAAAEAAGVARVARARCRGCCASGAPIQATRT